MASANQGDQESILPPISSADLKDSTLGRLNRNLQLLAQQIQQLQQSAGLVPAPAATSAVPQTSRSGPSGPAGAAGPAGPAGPPGSGGGTTATDRHTISGAFNITASVLPAPAKGFLVVVLTMASGAVQPTWDAASFSVSPGAVSILVGAKVIVNFCDDGAGKWEMSSPPMVR